MKLYDVLNTTGDLPNSGSSWFEALECELGKELPEYYHGEKTAGGHMSSHPVCSGVQKTEYIAYIPKSFNENQNNHISIDVDLNHFALYEDVKSK